MPKNRRFVLSGAAAAILLVLSVVPAAMAQIPAAANCAPDQPPPDAGLFATPGGFLLVHPRNAAISDRYTGCKTLWVVDAPDRFLRLMTLYFESGRLRIAQAYEKSGSSRGTCVLPGKTPGCEDIESNPLAALRLPTWPRTCIAHPNDPQCAKEPN